MKKIFYTLSLVLALATWQACGPKQKEENAEETTATVTDEEKKTADAIAKREKLAAARAEKAEQRRLAYEAMAKTSPTYKDASGVLVYYTYEVSPSFVGGEDAMTKYLNDNLQYPQEAQDKGVEGTVFVDFIVGANGKVREVVATDVAGENIDQSLKDEAIRVVSAMPAWVPGLQNGTPVHAKFSVPITFMLR